MNKAVTKVDPIEKVCPWCGRKFTTTSAIKRYCSWQCRNAYYYKLSQLQNPYYKRIQERYQELTKDYYKA